MTHDDIWQTIDYVAHMFNLSSSGLAKYCGLDSTTFNKSKRVSRDGKLRWPSTLVLSKIFAATGIGIDEFAKIVLLIQNKNISK